MTRGNQREIDRQRAANRHDHSGAKLEGDPNKRREADAKALQDKIARKEEIKKEKSPKKNRKFVEEHADELKVV